MERITEILKEIETLTNNFMTDANTNLKGNKAAGRRARKGALSLTKLLKEYRSKVLELEKTEKE